MHKINLAAKLAEFDTHWDPKVIASYNANDVMVVKFQGEFPNHSHATSDDFFLVLAGEVKMDVEGDVEGVSSVTSGPGELLVVPAGTVHRPRAVDEAHVLLIEPNTGTSGAPAAAKDHI